MPKQRKLADPGNILARVDALAHNLWWTWNPDAQRLFAALDPVLWDATHHNPLATLRALPPERRATLAADDEFAALLAHCERELRRYLTARTWFDRTATRAQKRRRIAYFCAEFALHESVPLYAGGLGVLAGDHLKSASDLGLPLVGVGLLYRCGYYRQEFTADGATRATYPEYDFAQWPIADTGRRIDVPLAGRSVRAAIWQLQVGRVPLYLLDTDLPANRPKDRAITRHLYGGDQETRIRQEIVLGIGGVRALAALGVNAAVVHLNEGHAAFACLERLRGFLHAGFERTAAVTAMRQTGVFTTHTPVAAGHDRFPPRLVNKYLGRYADELGLTRPGLLGLGRENPANRTESFCMTLLALSGCAQANGVSQLHGEVSRNMWQHAFGVTHPDEVPIGHITNGIHAETWLAPEIRPLYDRYLKPHWVGADPTDNWWRRADRIPPAELWAIRRVLRAKLVNFVRRRLVEQIERGAGPVRELIAAHETFDEDTLTIGFARRFATYKRAPLIFHDAKRIAAILNDPKRPVQLVFAGKAHPRDTDGQAFARRIYQFARRAGFRGRVVLLEEYDMQVGRILTAGCDVWLNNPLRPQEASGTSGMKPPLHGGLNCSIPDGWWPEAFNGRNGWTIGDGTTESSRARQDRRDATAIYELLEHEIVPLFYERGRDGVPRRWVQRAIESMKTVCGRFNTHRMVAQYLELYSG